MLYDLMKARWSISALLLITISVSVFAVNQPAVEAAPKGQLDPGPDCDGMIYQAPPAGPENRISDNILDAGLTDFDDDDFKNMPNSATVEYLNLTRTDVTDEGLQKLKPLPSLQLIVLDQSSVTDKGISFLDRHRNLQGINAQICSLNFEGFGPLKELPKLRVLNLNGSKSQITEKGLAALAALPHLEKLKITACKLPPNPRPFAVFDKSPIRELYLSQPGMTANVIASLQDMPALRKLSIGGMSMDKNKARELRKLSKLSKLDLTLNKNVSGDAIKELAAMSNLKELALWNSEITPEDTQYLKSQLRNCHVFGPKEAPVK